MTAAPVRWGVLGTAAIATGRFLPAFAGAQAARVVAIGSRELAKAQAVANEFGVPRAHGSYEALLADPDVEAVYVPLPNHLHVEWSIRALEAGKHVLCEKPLCLSAAEVTALIEARDRTGRHIEEAFSYRNHPQWERVAQVLASGAIGAPRAVQCTAAKQFHDPKDIRNDPDKGGGGLYDLGSYTISACSLVFPRLPQRVVAALDRDPRFRTDRLSTALLDYGDAHASFTVGTQSGPDAWASHQQFSVLGSEGWLRCDFPFAHGRPAAARVMIGDRGSHGNVPTQEWSFAPVNQYTLQTDRFSRLLRGEHVPSWPIEDALRTLQIIEALFRSAASGGWERPSA
ncbi:MAG TPA: Gfo/Idh/MocA family oxidoreductase [Casimicrobiaceae bacterium]|nr:Gfo/Idh/MocA family oxidoreductase [Casimicrobiaceae bacterium]